MGARRWRWIWRQGGSSELLPTNSCRFRLTDSSLEQMVWPDIPETRFIASTQEKFSSRLRCLAADSLWTSIISNFVQVSNKTRGFPTAYCSRGRGYHRVKKSMVLLDLEKGLKTRNKFIEFVGPFLVACKRMFFQLFYGQLSPMFLRLIDHRKWLFPKVGNGTKCLQSIVQALNSPSWLQHPELVQAGGRSLFRSSLTGVFDKHSFSLSFNIFLQDIKRTNSSAVWRYLIGEPHFVREWKVKWSLKNEIRTSYIYSGSTLGRLSLIFSLLRI